MLLKKIIVLLLYLLCYDFVHAQDLDRLFDQYTYQERYLNSVQVLNGIDRNPLPSKASLHLRLLGDTANFPGVIIVNGITDIKALQASEIRERVTGMVVTVQDSTEFINTMKEVVDFPNLRYLHIGAEPGVVDKSYAHERANRYRLPDNIRKLEKLEIIAFTGGLVDLDDAIQKLSGLKSLKALSLSQVHKPIPPTLTDLGQVRLIKLSNDNLKGLDLGAVMWESVRLWGGQDQILETLAGIESLKSLELDYPRLSNTDILLKFKHLKRFSFSGSSFKGADIFQKISLMKDLNWLKLRHSGDIDLTGISNLKSLKYLELISGGFPLQHPETLSGISGLTDLEELRLASYRVPWVPDVFIGLKSLKVLTLWSAERDLPESIFLLPELDSLVVLGAGVKSLPELPAYGFQKLKVLRINLTGLKKVPSALLKLTELEVLDLVANQISSMPAEGWNQLKKLRSVSFAQNQLERLPAGIGQLTRLQFINAAENKLLELPASLGDCKVLKRLILDNNNIASLPEGLKNADSLEMLNLSNNPNIKESSVWKVILGVPRTNFFVDVGRTGLRNLPESECWRHIRFTDLLIEHNKLQTLPTSFSEIKSFQKISLKGNPLVMPQQLTDVRIVSKADLKIVFDQLNVSMAGSPVQNEDYAQVLLDRVSYLSEIKDWTRVIAFGDEALKIAPAVYNKSWYAGFIGIARFRTKDYKGAIADLERFAALERSPIHRSISVETNVELCLYDAYIALGEKEKASKARALFEKSRGDIETFYTFLDHYLDTKDKESIKELMARALPAYKANLIKERQPNGNPDPSFLCEYAEVLILAEKPKQAAELLRSMTDDNYRSSYLSIKNCLLAMATYLSKEKSYEEAKTELLNSITSHRKIAEGFWNFETLNRWLDFTNKSSNVQENLKSMQHTAMGIKGG